MVEVEKKGAELNRLIVVFFCVYYYILKPPQLERRVEFLCCARIRLVVTRSIIVSCNSRKMSTSYYDNDNMSLYY